MSRQTREYRYDFRGHLLFPVTASGAGTPFVTAVSAAAGSPTVQGVTDGGARLAFDNTVEVQNLCLYMGDVLPFDIDDIIRAWFIVKAAQTFDATSQVAWGLAGARNDAIDTIAQAALFRCIANNAIVVESDDGTNNNDDVATGLTLSGADWARYEINFAERITTIDPPGVSTGRPSNIGFYGANSLGSLRRVASGTLFDMSNYATGLQFFVQLQKTADANTDAFDILECGVEVTLPNYA